MGLFRQLNLSPRSARLGQMDICFFRDDVPSNTNQLDMSWLEFPVCTVLHELVRGIVGWVGFAILVHTVGLWRPIVLWFFIQHLFPTASVMGPLVEGLAWWFFEACGRHCFWW